GRGRGFFARTSPHSRRVISCHRPESKRRPSPSLHTMTTELSPAQQRARDALLYALPLANVFTLSGRDGSGKSTVLNAVCDATGGAVLTLADFIDAMRSRHPLAMEETFYQLVLDALARTD